MGTGGKLTVAAGLLFLGTHAIWGQAPGSLRSVSVPQPLGLSRYVRDPNVLVALGKALFWDMQAGSDGQPPAFRIEGINVRRVTSRNSPTVDRPLDGRARKT